MYMKAQDHILQKKAMDVISMHLKQLNLVHLEKGALVHRFSFFTPFQGT